VTFPADDYTPFGYLANPYHRARSWSDVSGGLIRSTDDFVGFGWVEPTARKPHSELAIVSVLRWGDRLYVRRSDFANLGYRSRHHSSALFTYDWEQDNARAELGFALGHPDALAGRFRLANPGGLASRCEVFLVCLATSREGRWDLQSTPDGWQFVNPVVGLMGAFALSGADRVLIGPESLAAIAPALADGGRVAAGFRFEVDLRPEESFVADFSLARGSNPAALAIAIARRADEICAERRASDASFYANASLPVGDWPSEWKRGWIYDLETTRACLFPAGGIFHEEWPSWMISWPRVVLAEGSLDATRLSYADPERALRLTRTILADAPAPNVPCVFQGGEPNMVAKDGTVCGTSPAWCVPFYNLWLLYWRTLDRRWLADVLPPLEAYLNYWLRERTDEEGWAVYKCTWEAGEDCTPRLDPAAEGDEVISRFVRPVELQATMSQSAAILAAFARELGDESRDKKWRAVAQQFAVRTQELWDPIAGRFRDWDKRRNDFLAAPGSPVYWDTDPVRFSALSLTPLIAELASREQKARLADEIAYYDSAPWCQWPSWSFVVAEAATTTGWYRFASQFAERIIRRVYQANDRRTLAEATRPTPGTAPEFWPLDLAKFDGSDGYGWGATTTSLWVRQIFGFLEDFTASEFSFRLVPGLPPDLFRPGRRFAFHQLPYRGARLDLEYQVTDSGLDAIVRVDSAEHVRVFGPDGNPIPLLSGRDGEARFSVTPGEVTRVVLA
jgi:hypothetical protein